MNPIRAWNRFWFAPISARPLGLYRILFGLMVLAHLAFLTVDLDFWYTDAGLLQGDEARLAAGPLRFSPLQWIQDPVSVRLFFAALAVVAIAFTLGWHTRIMGVLVYMGLLSLHHRNISTNCGPDTLMMVTCFCVMLCPCGAAYSLDARRVARRRGTPADVLIIPWAQRLLQIQLCIIYFCTAQAKCTGATWLGGTAVHFVLFNSEVRQFNLEWLGGVPDADQRDDSRGADHRVRTRLLALVSPDSQVGRALRSAAPRRDLPDRECAAVRRTDDRPVPSLP